METSGKTEKKTNGRPSELNGNHLELKMSIHEVKIKENTSMIGQKQRF